MEKNGAAIWQISKQHDTMFFFRIHQVAATSPPKSTTFPENLSQIHL